MRHLLATTTMVLLAGTVFTGSATAADIPIGLITPPPVSIVPQSAFFVGLGGSWNSVNFGNQDVFAIGTSFTPPFVGVGGPQPAIIGSAAGSTGLTLDTKSALAPAIQAGYFQHFSGSSWMWGGKFAYSYLGLSSATNLLIPQAGGFQQGGTFTPFTGNYVARGYRQTLVNQMSLVPFIGQSFERSYLYFGAGPTVAQTKTSIDSLTGFADINGLISSITGIGSGSSYSTSQWLWGGIATVGATYFIDRTWFVDMSYSYAMTGTKTSDWGGSWSFNPIVSGPRSGTNAGTSSGSVSTQAFTVSINKAF